MQIENLSKRVAEKLNIPKELSEEICRSQFKFLLDNIQTTDKPTISLIYLGKFYKNKKYKQDGSRNRKADFLRIQEPDI